MRKENSRRLSEVNKAIDSLHRHFNGSYGPLAFALDSILHMVVELSAGVNPEEVVRRFIRYNVKRIPKPR